VIRAGAPPPSQPGPGEGYDPQQRYEVGKEFKTLLVVVEAIVGVFGFFFALYVLERTC
jgi:hypothetical protein